MESHWDAALGMLGGSGGMSPWKCFKVDTKCCILMDFEVKSISVFISNVVTFLDIIFQNWYFLSYFCFQNIMLTDAIYTVLIFNTHLIDEACYNLTCDKLLMLEP